MEEPRTESPALANEPSVVLYRRARQGDRGALNELCSRYLPRLKNWATGRLPMHARDHLDTDDLVQDVILNTVSRLGQIEFRNDGAVLAYLRQALLNRIRDQLRRTRARGFRTGEGEERDFGADHESPLEHCIGREAVERYERALARLDPSDSALIIAKLEMDSDYAEMARALGKPSADAARVAAGRALLQLAREMKRDGA